MKSKLLLIFIAAFTTALLAYTLREEKKVNPPNLTARDLKLKNIIPCSPNWSELKQWLEEVDIPPMPGAGTHQWKISTNNDSAQFYFNQGINMYYGFHIIEAMASFKKAAKFDPGCAMLHWAQALTYGPNINDYGYAASPEALEATQKALKLASSASEAEKALIDAMTVRYTADSADTNREELNKAYTAKMKEVYEKFPAHQDVQTLYADAIMLEHPWDLWHVNGTPKPWTPLIREVLEKILEKYPNHPGANHYYIHVMEPSPYADKALPSADRLGSLTPHLAHMVHMPSHIYLRTGHYEKGAAVNESAVSSYKKYLDLYAPVAGNDFIYLIHNLHMQTNHAMMLGQAKYSVASAKATMESVPDDYLQLEPPLGNYLQYLHMTPALVYVRFGKWNELLALKAPAGNLIYANILHHFGRGMAFTAKRQMKNAKAELENIKQLMKDSSLLIPMSPFSPVIEGAKVAKNMLKGSIALAEKNYDESIASFKTASETEENMVYTEPRDWMLNPTHYLGNACLKASRWKEAEHIFLRDLKNNHENGWALYGLYLSLSAQKKTVEASGVMTRFNKAFSKADIKITSPVY
jgi:tetratricopeptide (TPR) repeat protein